MNTELVYINLENDKQLFEEPITSTGFLFIPNEGDTLLLNGWGYIVSRKEFSYEQGVTRIIITCVPESKKR